MLASSCAASFTLLLPVDEVFDQSSLRITLWTMQYASVSTTINSISAQNRRSPAFQLLSHEAKHAPLIQLAVDMLARLGTAAEEIVEVLLSRGQLVDAIRFINSSCEGISLTFMFSPIIKYGK
uniref:Mic1 domain-containing protein n=1 Tax=Parascaris equorum TaxID=6256 RepID=A0A914S1A7_PAREQ